MLCAFLGKPEVRTAALARLEQRARAGKLTQGALFFNGQLASPAAALVNSDDGQVWQAQLGLAQWLAFAIDHTCNGLPADKTVQRVEALLQGIALGSDTARLGSRVVQRILQSVAQQLATCGDHARDLLAAGSMIEQLHAELLAGGTPPPAAWRAARKAAVDATNQLADPLEKAFGACVEAAGWHPGLSPTTVGDVLRLRGQVPTEHVDQLFGWTAEDDQRTRTLLAEMHTRYLKDKPFAGKDVFMHLREDHPEAEARLLAYTRFQRGENARAAELAAQQLLQAVQELS